MLCFVGDTRNWLQNIPTKGVKGKILKRNGLYGTRKGPGPGTYSGTRNSEGVLEKLEFADIPLDSILEDWAGKVRQLFKAAEVLKRKGIAWARAIAGLDKGKTRQKQSILPVAKDFAKGAYSGVFHGGNGDCGRGPRTKNYRGMLDSPYRGNCYSLTFATKIPKSSNSFFRLSMQISLLIIEGTSA